MDMTGFFTDPWGGADLFDVSGFNFGTTDSGSDITSVVNTMVQQAPQIAPVNVEPATSGSFLGALKDITNFGLATYGQLTNANLAVKDSNLKNYLAQSQLEMAKTQIGGQLDVAKINATANEKLATAKVNAANTLGVAGNLGVSAGNNSLMLWLTILGLGFGFLQLVKK